MASCYVQDLGNALVISEDVVNSYSSYNCLCNANINIALDCAGMEGSDEFAVQVFDSLARKRGIVKQVLTKDELKDFWEQLSDQGFDNRLRTFFDMLVILMDIFWFWHGSFFKTCITECGIFPDTIL